MRSSQPLPPPPAHQVVEYLQKRGVPTNQIPDVVLKHPRMFEYKVRTPWGRGGGGAAGLMRGRAGVLGGGAGKRACAGRRPDGCFLLGGGASQAPCLAPCHCRPPRRDPRAGDGGRQDAREGRGAHPGAAAAGAGAIFCARRWGRSCAQPGQARAVALAAARPPPSGFLKCPTPPSPRRAAPRGAAAGGRASAAGRPQGCGGQLLPGGRRLPRRAGLAPAARALSAAAPAAAAEASAGLGRGAARRPRAAAAGSPCLAGWGRFTLKGEWHPGAGAPRGPLVRRAFPAFAPLPL
jgi:hypothetical protein